MIAYTSRTLSLLVAILWSRSRGVGRQSGRDWRSEASRREGSLIRWVPGRHQAESTLLRRRAWSELRLRLRMMVTVLWLLLLLK